MTTHEKIKYIKEMLTIVEAKISELNVVHRELIRELESIRKEMEMERLYDWASYWDVPLKILQQFVGHTTPNAKNFLQNSCKYHRDIRALHRI